MAWLGSNSGLLGHDPNVLPFAPRDLTNDSNSFIRFWQLSGCLSVLIVFCNFFSQKEKEEQARESKKQKLISDCPDWGRQQLTDSASVAALAQKCSKEQLQQVSGHVYIIVNPPTAVSLRDP